MQFDKITEISMLFDFYGQLLTEKQREIYSLYHEDNLSLSEIAAEINISRQGVHEALKKAEKLLYQYEDNLKLIEKFSQKEKAIETLDMSLETLIKENKDNKDLIKKLNAMKKIIDDLND